MTMDRVLMMIRDKFIIIGKLDIRWDIKAGEEMAESGILKVGEGMEGKGRG